MFDNLVYEPTYSFTGFDIYDASGSEITYEVIARPPARWGKITRKWLLDGSSDPQRAMDCLALVLGSVSQGSEWCPLGFLTTRLRWA